MVLDILIKVLFLSGFVTILGFGFYIWLNSRDASDDEQSYDDEFDVRNKISRANFVRESEIEPEEDHEKALKAYAVRHRPKPKPTPRVKVSPPPKGYEDGSNSGVPDSEYEDAEIVDAPNFRKEEEDK